MSQKTKIAYLKILLNIKNNAYENNTGLLKKDLIVLKKIFLTKKDNQQMQKLEKNMQKVLTKTK